MEGKSIFISSCSRRQLARRRPARSALRVQITIAVVVLAAALAAVLTGRL
jgi:hypothetical protein